MIDAHTATFERPWTFPILNAVTRWTIRNAWAIIVTSTKLQELIYHEYGVLPIVLEDGPLLGPETPKYRSSNKRKFNGSQHHRYQSQATRLQRNNLSMSHQFRSTHESASKNFAIAVFSSFATDEPIQEIVEAARIVLDTTTFYITGDNSRISERKLLKWKRSAKKIIFTGFLDCAEYINLLEKVDAIMVLTKQDYTMLSGAHEALGLEKPLITSDWRHLREYFVRDTIYVNNSSIFMSNIFYEPAI